ncbi:MAG: biotin/lipoyl-containing protein [Acidimicrobiia bacterium]
MTPPLPPSKEPASDLAVGESLSVSERVIVAPAMGVFHRLDDRQLPDGHAIERGDVIGVVQSLGASTPVQSPFQGLLVAILVFEGERVRPGQAVAWLRVA